MTRARKSALWILAVVALAYGWFHLSFPRAQFNYKLTLEAVTPDGPKTGSTVVSLDFGSSSISMVVVGRASLTSWRRPSILTSDRARISS